jgi:hypothetical protein
VERQKHLLEHVLFIRLADPCLSHKAQDASGVVTDEAFEGFARDGGRRRR